MLATHRLNMHVKALNCLFIIVGFVSIDLISTTKAATQTSVELGELLQLQILFRHADRTPVSFYPNDPYRDDKFDWVEGVGGLIKKGEERAFLFGDVLQQKYSNFLENMLVQNVLAQSSPVRRVIETNLAFLSGLLPPRPEQYWSNETELAQLWQPIAVQTASKEKAYMLGETGPCPEADKISATIDSLSRVKQMFASHQKLLEQLTNFTGSKLITLKNVGDLYDTLYCELNYGLELPTWTSVNIMQQLKQFRELEFSIFADLPSKFLRLKAGPFLLEMLQNLNETSTEQQSANTESKRVFTYSTHDKVLSAILHALGLFQEQPSYSSGIIIEKRANPNKQQQTPLVYLYYANVTDNFNIYPLKLSSSKTFKDYCSDYFCPLTSFAAALKPYLPENIEMECGVPQNNRSIFAQPSLAITLYFFILCVCHIYV